MSTTVARTHTTHDPSISLHFLSRRPAASFARNTLVTYLSAGSCRCRTFTKRPARPRTTVAMLTKMTGVTTLITTAAASAWTTVLHPAAREATIVVWLRGRGYCLIRCKRLLRYRHNGAARDQALSLKRIRAHVRMAIVVAYDSGAAHSNAVTLCVSQNPDPYR